MASYVFSTGSMMFLRCNLFKGCSQAIINSSNHCSQAIIRSCRNLVIVMTTVTYHSLMTDYGFTSLQTSFDRETLVATKSRSLSSDRPHFASEVSQGCHLHISERH